MEIGRGEIWLANLSPTQGTEQAGIRPVLIIQTDRANPHSPHTVIVPFTTKIRKEILPSHVSIKAGSEGTKEDSVLLCEQIRVIDKQRLIKKIGKLDETTICIVIPIYPRKTRNIRNPFRVLSRISWVPAFCYFNVF